MNTSSETRVLPDHAALYPAVGLYVHFPFCAKKCRYCDFPSFSGQDELMAGYVDALHREIDASPRVAVRSVFLGGGTPSYLPADAMAGVMAHLFAHFAIAPDAEITMEANPGNERLHAGEPEVEWARYRAMGLNRVSLGVQSFDPGLLSVLGRIHSPEEALQAVAAVKRGGFQNLSIDLMYGLPSQSLAQWRETLERAIALDLPHLSAYSLIVEPHTPFETFQRQGRLPLPSEDEEQEMAALAQQLLGAAGYRQYEISNWAKPGFESRHNQVYWLNEPWLGLGSGAHAYFERRRWANPFTIQAYLKEGPTAMPQEAQSLQDELEETMFMGLRMTAEGVSESRFRARFGVGLRERYGAVIADLEGKGLVCWTGEHLHLSPKGLALGNEVFEAFLGA
ncbi:MAG TPA: radical SAM family heme chaperone HemW [Oscillatoriaceae cyanobacterium]